MDIAQGWINSLQSAYPAGQWPARGALDAPQARAGAPGGADRIWYKDFAYFLDSTKLLDFWPSPSMGIEERINSATRFLAYASLLLLVSSGKVKYLVFGLFLIGLLAYVHRSSEPPALQGTGPAPNPGSSNLFGADAQGSVSAHAPLQVNRDRDHARFARYLQQGFE